MVLSSHFIFLMTLPFFLLSNLGAFGVWVCFFLFRSLVSFFLIQRKFQVMICFPYVLVIVTFYASHALSVYVGVWFFSFSAFPSLFDFSLLSSFKRMAQDARVKWDFLFISCFLGFLVSLLFLGLLQKGLVGWLRGEGGETAKGGEEGERGRKGICV